MAKQNKIRRLETPPSAKSRGRGPTAAARAAATGRPHCEQDRTPGDTSAPQEEHRTSALDAGGPA